MSAQLLELIIFAGIAFYIINKLINTLGTTTDEDQSKEHTYDYTKKNYKGINLPEIKDITNSLKLKNAVNTEQNQAGIFHINDNTQYSDFIVTDNKQDIYKNLEELKNAMPEFDLIKFAKGSKRAFAMIIASAYNKDHEAIEELVDKRYIQHFSNISPQYDKIHEEKAIIEAKISEIYMFGNNVYIKVLFLSENLQDTVKSFQEEWTFSKNTLSTDSTWQLTNIDKPN